MQDAKKYYVGMENPYDSMRERARAGVREKKRGEKKWKKFVVSFDAT